VSEAETGAAEAEAMAAVAPQDMPSVLFWGWIAGPAALAGGLYWVAHPASPALLPLGAVLACAGFLLVLMPLVALAALSRARRDGDLPPA